MECTPNKIRRYIIYNISRRLLQNYNHNILRLLYSMHFFLETCKNLTMIFIHTIKTSIYTIIFYILAFTTQCVFTIVFITDAIWSLYLTLYTRVNKNPSAWNFLSPKPEVTCGTVAIIIRVVSLSPYLRIRAVSLSSIHYNQSHRVYINRRRQYICLIWN